MYYVITTLTTVGYGDIFPVETIGRALGNITMILGLVVIGLPLAVIGSNFQSAFDKYKTEKEKKKRKEAKVKVVLHHSINEFQKSFDELEKTLKELQLAIHQYPHKQHDQIALLEGHWKTNAKMIELSAKSIIKSAHQYAESAGFFETPSHPAPALESPPSPSFAENIRYSESVIPSSHWSPLQDSSLKRFSLDSLKLSIFYDL